MYIVHVMRSPDQSPTHLLEASKCSLPENLHRFLSFFFLFYCADRSFMFLVMFGNFYCFQVMPLPEAVLCGELSLANFCLDQAWVKVTSWL